MGRVREPFSHGPEPADRGRIASHTAFELFVPTIRGNWDSGGNRRRSLAEVDENILMGIHENG
jgi:hypothetical protein